MWIKLIGYLKLTQRFGLLIKTIELMIFDLLNFMLIFMILILAFATIFWNSFENYNTDYNGLT
jgi:hypothetical protein